MDKRIIYGGFFLAILVSLYFLVLNESTKLDIFKGKEIAKIEFGGRYNVPSGVVGNIFSESSIDFGDGCKISASSTTFKNGTVLTFNNSAKVGQSFSYVGKRYYLAVGKYLQISHKSTSTLPTKVDVKCGVNDLEIVLN